MYHSTIKGFKMQSGLYVVGTPIGNLSDMSPRAVEVLKNVDLIAAEDTRVFAKLAHHFDIKTKTVSCHEHNEREVVDSLVEKIINGQAIATVSDAGMPGISDPGFRLVRAARAANVPVFMVPGSTAVISALVLSGFPTDRFTFCGFFDKKKVKESIVERKAKDFICIQADIEKKNDNINIDHKRRIEGFKKTNRKFFEQNYYFICQK